MKFTTLSCLLAAWLMVSPIACGGSPATTTPDTGVINPDAGTTDTGVISPVDSGTNPVDTAVIADSGTPPTDTGPTMITGDDNLPPNTTTAMLQPLDSSCIDQLRDPLTLASSYWAYLGTRHSLDFGRTVMDDGLGAPFGFISRYWTATQIQIDGVWQNTLLHNWSGAAPDAPQLIILSPDPHGGQCHVMTVQTCALLPDGQPMHCTIIGNPTTATWDGI